MKKILAATAVAGTLLALIACEDTASTIGSSLVTQNVEIFVDTFTLTGKVMPLERIRPKTTNMLVGRIHIPEYGTLEASNVMQFLPSTALDTATYTWEDVKALTLNLQYSRGAFIGDSVAPMGLQVHRLNTILLDTLTSDFDPAGLFEAEVLGAKMYNASTFNESSTAQAATYRTITVDIDRDNTLGKKLFRDFQEHNDWYADGRVFAKNVFPGVYIDTDYGSGRLTQISASTITMHLEKYVPTDSVPDTVAADHTYYMVTPEVISNNNLRYTMAESLRKKIDEGEHIMVAPLGTDLEIEFPVKEIIAKFRSYPGAIVVTNSLSCQIPADSIANGYGVTPPPYLLMILKNEREKFFKENRLTDNITSFYAVYDATSQSYTFSSMKAYLNKMLETEGEIAAEDYTFDLVPVQINFENTAGSSSYYYSSSTSQVESEIQPYVLRPVMAHFHLDQSVIKYTYTLQNKK